jgi:hypothetical protein
MKWGDYCISSVSYDEKRTHIVQVQAYEDLGERFGSTFNLSRKEVLKKLKQGVILVTMTLGTMGWIKGHKLLVVIINKEEYIKTRADELTRDYLGELSEY